MVGVLAASASHAFAGGTQLRLETQDACLGIGQTQLVVEVNLRDATQNVVGGQFFLEYDRTKLSFVSGVAGNAPFVAEIFESVDTNAGRIIYGVGVLEGVGTAVDTTMARFTFQVIGEFCDTPNLVRFQPGVLPTRLTDATGASIEPALSNLGDVARDLTPPQVSPALAISVNADAGRCDATLNLPGPARLDACDAAPTLSAVRSDAQPIHAPFATGTTTVTWTVTDRCGNAASVPQSITVAPRNTVMATVELQGLLGVAARSRCVTFDLTPVGGGPVVSTNQTVLFVGGAIGQAVFEVPCGAYECISAREPLHSLSRRDSDFGPVGAVYSASFTRGSATNIDDPAYDALPGGNFDGDSSVDIVDFCVFIDQYAKSASLNTSCPGPFGALHADISGNGLVWDEDFPLIAANFLHMSETNCAGERPSRRFQALLPPWINRDHGLKAGPLKRLDVAGLAYFGLERFKRSDLNHDLVIDIGDIRAFENGARP